MKKYISSLIISTALLSACSADNSSNAQQTPEVTTAYKVSRTITAPDGGYDYISVDHAANQLFVGRDNGIMTVDLATGKTTTLLERADVAAVLLIPDTDLMLSTNNDSNDATILNRKTGAVIADIKTGDGPDGAFFEEKSGLIFVMNGHSEDVTVINPATAEVLATIPVGGKPEAANADGKGHVFVNVEDTNEIAVISTASLTVAKRYALPDCDEPTGMAYDPVTGLIISVCHNNIAKLIEAETGRNHGNIKIGSIADGSIFNPETRIGYVSCIDGTLTVYHLDTEGNATVLQTIKTADGARTEAYDPIADELYLPAAHVEWGPDGEYMGAEKEFKVVVVSQN
ncbi:YncE family protein [Kordiimonas pumila]|uniref:YncE family protein n=1 Tax=Kordiimonas pumila TaxID=2161677 RepID=A0ABV7D332_9PROT|nr:hypothetical protein [Kordiimonas pumila]